MSLGIAAYGFVEQPFSKQLHAIPTITKYHAEAV